MGLEIFGIVAEIVGVIAILLSLLYLARQVRASTIVSRSDAETEFQVRWNSMVDEFLGSTEKADIFRRGIHSLDLLTPNEKAVFSNFLGKMLDVHRIGMRMHEQGLLRDDLFEAGNLTVSSAMKSPGAQEWWKQSSMYILHSDFIDELMRRDTPPISSNPLYALTDAEGR
jgi:hypothetical protein